jgi:predicted metal-binding protein
MAYKPVWDMEYVYNADVTNEFRQVRVTLEISETQGRVSMHPVHMMTLNEINNVMREYEDDILKRMLTPYDSYYPVRLLYNGVECAVKFDSKRQVTEITIV